MNVKELKDLFNSLPEDRGLDLVVFDTASGQSPVASITQQAAMDVSPFIVIALPPEYYLTTVDPRASSVPSREGTE